jgi:hypothetical protein
MISKPRTSLYDEKLFNYKAILVTVNQVNNESGEVKQAKIVFKIKYALKPNFVIIETCFWPNR